MNKIVLHNRLLAIAKLTRNVPLFDVGTDHALLPVFLRQNGHTAPITASDIAELPAEKARKQIRDAGCDIEVRVTDGLTGIDLPDECDVVIAGMGGEMIRDILSKAPQTRKGGVRLLLQPMTRPEALSLWLAESGYEVIGGCYARDTGDGKIYRILEAVYTGKSYEITPAEALLGNFCRRDFSELKYLLTEKELRSVKIRLNGKIAGGEDAQTEKILIAELEKILREQNR